MTIVSILPDMSPSAGLQPSRSQRKCVSAEATHQQEGNSDLLNIIHLLNINHHPSAEHHRSAMFP